MLFTSKIAGCIIIDISTRNRWNILIFGLKIETHKERTCNQNLVGCGRALSTFFKIARGTLKLFIYSQYNSVGVKGWLLKEANIENQRIQNQLRRSEILFYCHIALSQSNYRFLNNNIKGRN